MATEHWNDMAGEVAGAMPPLSHLECTTCGYRRGVGDVAGKLRHGWPLCCGYTMRLFTVRELNSDTHLRNGTVEPGWG